MTTPGTDDIPDVPTFAELETLQPRSGYAARLLYDADTSEISPDLKSMFVAKRRDMVKTHTALASVTAKERAQFELDIYLPNEAYKEDMPVPGGVGYGVQYADNFKNAFTEGTALFWEVLFPNTPGGTVQKDLYLTATNRASLGVEALVAYRGQSEPSFLVYDWSKPEPTRWFGPIPISKLGSYTKNEAISGKSFRTLPLVNMTYQAGGGAWTNQVLLLNNTNNNWEPVYTWTYPSDMAKQHAVYFGSWGPIVETFDPVFKGTLPMGSLNAKIRNASQGKWGEWIDLLPATCAIRKDKLGFEEMIIKANSSWIVTS